MIFQTECATLIGMKKFLIFLGVVVGVIFNIIFGGFLDGNANVMAEIRSENLPEIFIKAVNPGYTVDGTANVEK